ncbi:MAG: alanine--glyoxylate aminotransferase family protein [Candidatus Heimdallarchaeota archaeon]|nr:alanine--glyoxylate aminotransferase family protein [Candidatus Heimdallarchaeota archaeon]
MRKKLFIPGPTEVFPEVLNEQTKLMIGHRSKDFTELYAGIISKLQKYHDSQQWATVATASGTLFMDVTGRSLVKERCLCGVNGAFSLRAAETIRDCGKEIEMLEAPWGQAIKPEMIREKLSSGKFDTLHICHNETSTGIRNPIYEIGQMMHDEFPDIIYVIDSVSAMGGDKVEPEKIHSDMIYASSQKCYALPPGLAIAFCSERAIERAKEVPNRGQYTDLVGLHAEWLKRQQTPTTPNISLMYAMTYQLDKMIAETQEKRYQRHVEMMKFTHQWANKHFSMFPEKGYESVTVSTINKPQDKDWANLTKELANRGIEISNGYGKIKETTFRIGHMGDWTLKDIQNVCKNIEEIWEL